MANLKLNNVVVVTESAGTATVQSGIFKAKDGTAAFTVADSTGAATFTGATTLSSTLGVTGVTTLTGAATLSSTLGVTGATTLTGAATLSSTLAVTGAATLSSTLTVTGASTFSGDIKGGTIKAADGTAAITIANSTGAVSFAGDLTVNGTTSTINSTTLQIDDKNIDLAHSPSGSEGNDAAVDGGGITLKSSDSDKTISWVNATDAWTFNQHLFPSADNASDLGSAAKRWRNIYTTDLHLNNDRGDWTIIEEEEYLSIRNNKNGKMHKFVLEEIE
jgi:hypothetical protein